MKMRLIGGFWLCMAASSLVHAAVVPGQYIVHFKGDAETFTARSVFGAKILQRYEKIFNAVAVQASAAQLQEIESNPDVDWVEPNHYVYANATQSNATWGIDRIDARSGRNGVYEYAASGLGVHAYIIDTGIRSTHEEFTGRVGSGYGGEDCNGHGTHVAGTIGGTTYGVAKNVSLHGVRVLGCDGSGTDADVIAGIEWVAKNAVKPAVANMSLGGSVSKSLDQAVQKAIESGIVFVVAAGNENTDACKSSPADVKDAITVGATTKTDARASFSNYGTCVDIFAPGDGITSSWNSSDTGTSTISGTSMASPHVAGTVALYLEATPDASPTELASSLIGNATAGIVTNPGRNSPNFFVFTNPSGDVPVPNPTPTPTPTPTPPPTPAPCPYPWPWSIIFCR